MYHYQNYQQRHGKLQRINTTVTVHFLHLQIMLQSVVSSGLVKLSRRFQLSWWLRSIFLKANNPSLALLRDEKIFHSCHYTSAVFIYSQLRHLKLLPLMDITSFLQFYVPYSLARRIKMDVNRKSYTLFCCCQCISEAGIEKKIRAYKIFWSKALTKQGQLLHNIKKKLRLKSHRAAPTN